MEVTLENFCTSLFYSVGFKSLKVYLCGVQLWSRMNAYSESIAGMERLHYVLRGIRKLQGNAHLRPPRLPITLHILHFMFDGAALFPSVHDRDMLRSAITLAFFGLLRISESAPVGVKIFTHQTPDGGGCFGGFGGTFCVGLT